MSDRTKFKSYATLKKHQIYLADTHLKQEVNFDRTDAYTQDEGIFHLDFSKTHLDDKALSFLEKYADDCEMTGFLTDFFKGERVNISEDRPALHFAWRAPDDVDVRADGRSVMPEIIETRHRMKEFAEGIANGSILSKSGERFLDIIHVGMGGSVLPAKYLSQALESHKRPGMGLHFVEQVDGTEIQALKRKLRPETTLVVVVSKTFRTQETLLNATYLKEWLDDELGAGAHQTQMVAATANVKNAHQFGIKDEMIFPFKNWVGGRWSTTTPSAFSIPLVYGWETFNDVLKGAFDYDEIMKKTAYTATVAFKMAAISVWYRVFWKTVAEGLFPYTKRLGGVKDLVQMLTYESNGKPSNLPTGTFLYGDVGSGVEHRFFQKIQQDPEKALSTFILIEEAVEKGYEEHHQMTNLHALGFAEAFAVGAEKTKSRPDAEVCEGNQPSLILTLKNLSPYAVGQLIALFEYKTILEAGFFGINPFDNHGVTPGKEAIRSLYQGKEESLLPSTQALLKRLKHVD